MSETTTYRKSSWPWVVLLACCIVDAIGFTMPAMSFSVYLTPIKDSLGLSMTEVQMYNTATMTATIISTMFGDRFLRIGVGKLTAICSALVIVGFFTIANAPGVPAFIFAGACSGIAYPLLSIYTMPVVISNWFYKNQGTWISICLACSGIGGFIMSPTVTGLIAAYGWQQAMMMASLIMIVPMLLGIFVIRLNPLDKGILPHGATMEDLVADKDDSGEAALDLPGTMFKDAIKSPAFIVLAIVLFAMGVQSAYATNLNPLVQSAGYGAVVAGAALSASSLGNLVCKPVLGILRDRFGAVLSGALGFGMLIIGLCLYMVGMSVYNEAMMIFAAFVGGLGGGAGLIMPSLYTKDAFGSKDFDRIYSIQMGVRAIGAAVVSPVVGLMYDASGSYVPPIIMWIVACAIMIVGGYFAVKMGRKMWGGPSKIIGKPVDTGSVESEA